MLSPRVCCFPVRPPPASPGISGGAAQACDSMQNGAGTHSTYICLPPRLLSHRLFLPSLSPSPDAASGSVPGVCPSHLSWSLLWPRCRPSPLSVSVLCLSAFSSSASVCLGTLLRSWIRSPASLGQLKGPRPNRGLDSAPHPHPRPVPWSVTLMHPLLPSSGPRSGAPAWCCPCWRSPGCRPSWP